VLGLAQLIIYVIYKNKSISAKSVEKMKEEGSAHFVKVGIEMGALEGDEEANLNGRSLHKGRSLPKPSVIRQYSFQRIFKTLSLSPYEIHSNLPCEDVTEKKITFD
jgi:solute carrier family 50 protein (sugar transporter)